jgi:hypothetical protein
MKSVAGTSWMTKAPLVRSAVGLVVTLLAVGSLQLAAGARAGAANQSAGDLFRSSQSAAATEPSLHYVSVTTSTSTSTATGGVSVTITGDVSAFSGEQTIVAQVGGQVGHVTVCLVASIAYFKGDEPGLAVFMGLPQTDATKFAGQWISVEQTDAAYRTVAAGLETSSVLSEVPLSGPMSLHGTMKKEGQSVLVVKGFDSGTAAGTTKKVSIPVTLYLAAHGKHLPVLYTATHTLNGKHLAESLSFGAWGHRVAVTAPSGAVPIASLGIDPTEE